MSTNPWLQHVKAFKAENPEMSHKEALQNAKTTYTKQSGQGVKSALAGAKLAVRNKARKVACPKKSRPLLPGEKHHICANFTGPGTRTDLPKVRNHPPLDDADACSRTHDIEYGEAFKIKDKKKRAIAIRKADEKAIPCYSKARRKARKPAEVLHAIAGQAGIQAKMTAENTLPKGAIAPFVGDYYGSKEFVGAGCSGKKCTVCNIKGAGLGDQFKKLGNTVLKGVKKVGKVGKKTAKWGLIATAVGIAHTLGMDALEKQCPACAKALTSAEKKAIETTLRPLTLPAEKLIERSIKKEVKRQRLERLRGR